MNIPYQLDAPHGDAVELAGKHRELLHIVEHERHWHDGGHADLPQVEPLTDLQTAERIPSNLQ